MPDPIEQLARYGEALGAATPATSVDALVPDEAVSGGGAEEVGLADLPPTDTGRSRRPWLIAAAVAAIVAIGATALVREMGEDTGDDLDVMGDPLSVTTVAPTSIPTDIDGSDAPDLIVTAGANETQVPPGASYCWAEPESTKPAVCVDMIAPGPEELPTLESDVGVPLQVSLPGDDWTITAAQLPWADAGRGDCGLIRWTPDGTEEPGMPVLLTAAIPAGTHTLRIEAEVAGNQLAYYVVIDAGDGPVCLDHELETDGSLTYVYEYYGLTREEAIAKAGDGYWRDISSLGWPELVGRTPEILGQVDLRFDDGRVQFAILHKSGLPSVVEGVEIADDVAYLGLELEDAYALAQREGREYCPVTGPCRTKLDPERLQFHVDEWHQGTTVIGVTRS